MLFCGLTHAGKIRKDNQDVFLFRQVSDCLLAVLCDGVGGHGGGDQAAQTAIHTFVDKMEEKLQDLSNHTKEAFFDKLPTYIEKFFTLAADHANIAVLNQGKQTGLDSMSTTLICALFAKDQLHIFNVGDSRLYDITALPVQISKDQSWVQAMVDMGRLTPEQAKDHPNKNIIVSAIGSKNGVDGDYISLKLCASISRYMLCSDGLSDYMDISNFDDLFSETHSPDELCRLLIDRANSLGGKDNVTVLVIETA